VNTPSHLIVNMALLGRQPERAVRWAVAVGALLPDAPMFVFYAWHKLVLGLSEQTIWEELYFESDAWRAVFDGFNSVPIFGALLAIGLAGRRFSDHIGHRVLAALSASVLVHCAFDLPIHHNDGHRHFFPFSDWIYRSPVSYWDPEHHGTWAAAAEIALVAGAAVLLWSHLQKRRYRVLAAGLPVLMTIGWVAFYGRRLVGP